MHLPVGTMLTGRSVYQIGACLGQGGFGITYYARDAQSGQRLAIKEFFPAQCSSRTNNTTVQSYYGKEEVYRWGRERFLDEAKMLSSIHDLKSVVHVYDCFPANNTAYLAMEFLEGETLKEKVRRDGAIPAQQFLTMLRPLMKDLAEIHRRGVVHRDIAPDNIIMQPNGVLRLIDFGAARSFLGDKTMTVMVKKGYAPLEQYLQKGTTAATDVYALAATIYYCITGVVPPDSALRQGSGGAMMQSPRQLGANITAAQEMALDRALQVEQQFRTQSVAQLMAELWQENPTQPQPSFGSQSGNLSEAVTVLQEKPKVSPKRPEKTLPRWLIPAGAAGVLLAAGVLMGTLLSSKGGETSKSQAAVVQTQATTAATVQTAPQVTEATVPVTTAAAVAATEAAVIPKQTEAALPARRSLGTYAYSDQDSDHGTYTAEEFAAIVASGEMASYFPIGTKIKMVPSSTAISDREIVFELMAYRHYRRSSGGMAASVWMATEGLAELRKMNNANTWGNTGGWVDSSLRQWMNETLYPSLPSYWKKLITQVEVSTGAGGAKTNVLTCDDYLFLPSIGEVEAYRVSGSDFSDVYKGEIDSQAQELTFSAFPSKQSRQRKQAGKQTTWWLRSPWADSKSHFAYVTKYGVVDSLYSTSTSAVMVCFALG